MKNILRVQRAAWRDDIQFLLCSGSEEDGNISFGTHVVMHKPEVGEMAGGPTFQLKNEEAQRLMDELWNCGLRPSEGTGSAGSLAATERHLQDMRKIAFSKIKCVDEDA